MVANRTQFAQSLAANAVNTFGENAGSALGYSFVFAVAACADLGASAVGAGAAAAAPLVKRRIKRALGANAGKNHVLLELIHECRWEALAVIAKDLDKEQSGPDFKTNKWLRLIHDRALEQSKSPFAHTDPRDPNLLAKGRKRASAAPEHNADSSDAILAELEAFLSRVSIGDEGAGPKPQRPVDAAATAAALDDLFVGAFASRRTEAGAYIDRANDETLGWASTFRVLLAAKLRAPDNRLAQQVLLAFTAETLQATARIEAMTEGLSARVEQLGAAAHALMEDIAQIDMLVRRLLPKIPLGGARGARVMHERFVEMTYDARGTDLVGRDTELQALEGFLEADAPVSWWQIAGAAGQGKSRLAFEFIFEGVLHWRAGYLSAEQFEKIDWTTVEIDEDTLIIIDYLSAPERARQIGKAILGLHDRNLSGAKVRFLLIERAPFAVKGGDDGQPLQAAQWYNSFCGAGVGLNEIAHEPFALTLDSLTPENMLAVARSWRKDRGAALDQEQEAKLLSMLGYDTASGRVARDRAWRPLLCMIFADRLAEGDAQAISVGVAIELTLRNEETTYWRGVNPRKAADHRACLASIVRDLPAYHTVFERENGRFYGMDDSRTVAEEAALVSGLRVSDGGGQIGAILAREPDLLGEYLLQWRMGSEIHRPPDQSALAKIMRDAWSINPTNTLEFLIRLTEDADDLNIRPLRDMLASVGPAEELLTPVLAKLPGQSEQFATLYSAYYGLTFAVNALLDALPDDQRPDAVRQVDEKSGTFPLLMAAQNGHDAVVKLLLDALPDDQRPKAVRQLHPTDRAFPLLMAAQNGHDAVVKLLLDALPDDQRPDAMRAENEKNGTFPLLMAAQNGRDAVVKLLLDALPDDQRPDAVRQVDSVDKTFPLLMAAQEGHHAVVKLLLDALPDDHRPDAVRQLDSVDKTFPLLQAAQNGHDAVVKLLLDALPDDQRPDAVRAENEKSGTFPLLMAAQNGHDAVVKLLLDALPDDQRPKAVRQLHPTDRAFPLLMAAQNGHDAVVKLLLDALPDDQRPDAVRQVDSVDKTFPLLMAAQNGRDAVVKLLLDALPDDQRPDAVRQVDSVDKTFPLLMAAQEGHHAVVKLLLDALPDDHRPDAMRAENEKNGTFPLLMAAGRGHLGVVRQLIEAGADPEQLWKPGGEDAPAANTLDIAIINRTNPEIDNANGLQEVIDFLRSLGMRPIHPENANEPDYAVAAVNMAELIWGAANSGDEAGLVVLLEQIDPEHMTAVVNAHRGGETGTFPLLIAAGKGHLGVVRQLIEAGADPEQLWKPGGEDAPAANTLDIAIINRTNPEIENTNDLQEVIDFLRSLGMRPIHPENANEPDYAVAAVNMAELIWGAANSGDEAGLVVLLEQIDPEHMTAVVNAHRGGETGTFPLLMAAGKGHLSVVRQLIEAGADPEQLWRPRGEDAPAANALDMAILNQTNPEIENTNGLQEVIDYLRSLGVQPIHPENAGELDYEGPTINPDGEDS